MKSLLLTSFVFLSLLTSLSVQGQIPASTVFELGASAEVKIIEGYFQPGASGPAVDWDFGSLTDPGDAWTWNAIDPATTMFADSFPSANLAFPFPMGDTAESIVYYRFANDSLSLVGSASTLNSGGSFFSIYEQDPDLIATFPFGYQSSHSDVYRGINWIDVAGSVFKQTRYAETERTVESAGTLVTPLGTFPNAVRVKTTEAIDDTLNFFVPLASHQYITRYTWYAEDEKYILLNMDSIAVVQTGFTTVSYQTMYRSGEVTTSISERELAQQLNLTAFPNPAREQIQLRFQLGQAGPVRISLHNLVGQQLKELSIPGFGTQPQQTSLELRGIAPGIYLLRLHTSQGVAAQAIKID